MEHQEVTNLKKQLREQGYNLYVHSHPAGTFFPEHKRPHVTLHIILAGSLRVVIDGDETVLNVGERLEIPANTMYSAEVVGESPVVCIDARK